MDYGKFRNSMNIVSPSLSHSYPDIYMCVASGAATGWHSTNINNI